MEGSSYTHIKPGKLTLTAPECDHICESITAQLKAGQLLKGLYPLGHNCPNYLPAWPLDRAGVASLGPATVFGPMPCAILTTFGGLERGDVLNALACLPTVALPWIRADALPYRLPANLRHERVCFYMRVGVVCVYGGGATPAICMCRVGGFRLDKVIYEEEGGRRLLLKYLLAEKIPS